MMLDLTTAGPFPTASACVNNGHYKLWIDGQIVQDRTDFQHCWGFDSSHSVDVSNGLGQANFSHYITNKDPNQNYAAGKWWVDDVIVSTSPIPMLAADVASNNLAIVTSSPLPAGTQSVAYSQTIQAVNGSTPYSWGLAPGSNPLPAGLSLNSGTGVLSGTPTTAATYTPTIRVTDSVAATSDQAYSITINASSSAPTITTTSPLPAGTVGTAYSQTIAATGGTAPYTWTITSGSIPGLSLNSSTGVLSGTPTTPNVYSITAQVTDAVAGMGSKAFSVTINGTGGGTGGVRVRGLRPGD
jgi:hypothetical protein